MGNALYFGDNLEVLRESIRDESVDLTYLDRPFNSNATYNVLFKTPKGHQSDAQLEAFADTWHWGEHAEAAFADLMQQANTDVAEVIPRLRSVLVGPAGVLPSQHGVKNEIIIVAAAF